MFSVQALDSHPAKPDEDANKAKGLKLCSKCSSKEQQQKGGCFSRRQLHLLSHSGTAAFLKSGSELEF